MFLHVSTNNQTYVVFLFVTFVFPCVCSRSLTCAFCSQVKIWFQNRRMKLKKELRAVKEINEQVRRERDELEKMKDKDKNKDNSSSSSTSSTGSNGANNNTTNSSSSHPLTTNGGPDTPSNPTPLHGGGADIGGGGLSVDGKIVT